MDKVIDNKKFNSFLDNALKFFKGKDAREFGSYVSTISWLRKVNGTLDGVGLLPQELMKLQKIASVTSIELDIFQ